MKKITECEMDHYSINAAADGEDDKLVVKQLAPFTRKPITTIPMGVSHRGPCYLCRKVADTNDAAGYVRVVTDFGSTEIDALMHDKCAADYNAKVAKVAKICAECGGAIGQGEVYTMRPTVDGFDVVVCDACGLEKAAVEFAAAAKLPSREQRDITDEIIGRFVPRAAWEALPACASTIIETNDGALDLRTHKDRARELDRCLMRAASLEAAPGPVVYRGILLARGLVLMCAGMDPTEREMRAFGNGIRLALQLGLVCARIGGLGAPTYVPFSDGRCALYTYLFLDSRSDKRAPVDMNAEELRCWANAKMGFEAFVDEGRMPPDSWPAEMYIVR